MIADVQRIYFRKLFTEINENLSKFKYKKKSRTLNAPIAERCLYNF
jgi:hypothetical protein